MPLEPLAVGVCSWSLQVKSVPELKARHEAIEEAVDRRAWLRAHELVDEAPVAERLDGGDALDAEGLRDPRVLVRVDLDELDGAVARLDRRLERGGELPARAAPRRPEVHDDGHVVGCVDDLALEVGLVHVDRHGPNRRQTRPGGSSLDRASPSVLS